MNEAFYELVVRLVLDFVFKVDVLGQHAIGVEGSGGITLSFLRINIGFGPIMCISRHLHLDFPLTMIGMSAERWFDYFGGRVPLNIIIVIVVIIISCRVILLRNLH